MSSTEATDGSQVRKLQGQGWRVPGPLQIDSEIIFSTEGYASKASARNAIDSIKKNGPDAPTEDNSGG